MAGVRHHVRIDRPAAEVWALAGDAARLHEWFPGIVTSDVDGDVRTITLASGISMPERIVTVDDVARRFQYRITAPLFQEHQGTIDVLDLGDGTCVAVYSTDAEPRTMALVIGGGTAGALAELKQQMERPGSFAESTRRTERPGSFAESTRRTEQPVSKVTTAEG